MVKKVPSRYTGMPVTRSAATVKSAVHSIKRGRNASPNGTASSRTPRRTHNDSHRHRQSLPQRDEGAVFRVERIVLRDARAAVEAVLVGERRGLEAPVALEVEGAGALLAAGGVADAHAFLARA